MVTISSGRSRAELLTIARLLGVAGASRLDARALRSVVEAARARQAASVVDLGQRELNFSRAGEVKRVVLRGSSAKPVRIGLEILDHEGAFHAGPRRETVLRPSTTVRVPVTFRPLSSGQRFARVRRYRALLRVRELETQRVVGLLPLGGRGPGFVRPGTSACVYEPAPDTAPRAGNSPPAITLRVRPEIAWSGESRRVDWSVTGADTISEGAYRFGLDVLTDGTYTDVGGSSGPAGATARSYDVRIGRSTTFEVAARNADGPSVARVTAYCKAAVGYHAASTPAGAVYVSELDLLRRYLEDLEARLVRGCIRNNTDLDRFGDPYLRGSLTDDILAAMREVLILTGREKLPTLYRTSRLCEPGNYGSTPSDRAFVAICREMSADALTLLHELYHYAAARDNGNEDKAFAVSLGCF
jgi:hypothetical protein